MSRAGQPAEASDLIDIDELIAAYFDRKPDASVPDRWEVVSNTLVSRLTELTQVQTVPYADGEAECLYGHALCLRRCADSAQDIREEEAVGAGPEVPEAVHPHEAEDRNQIFALEQGGNRWTAGVCLLCLHPAFGFVHPRSQQAQTQCDDEQVSEHDAGPKTAKTGEGEAHQ